MLKVTQLQWEWLELESRCLAPASLPDAQSSEPDEWQEGEMRRKEAVVAQVSQPWLMKPPSRTQEAFLSAATPHLAQRQVPPPSSSEPSHQPNLLSLCPLAGLQRGALGPSAVSRLVAAFGFCPRSSRQASEGLQRGQTPANSEG